MDTIRVLSLIFLVLVVMIRATDASSRVLMADENPNPEKASSSPTPNSPPVNKELNQNPQPKPVKSPPDTKKVPAESPPVTKKVEDAKKRENSPSGNKDGGMQENRGQGPPKNDEKKNDDKQREKNDLSKSSENPNKGDGPKGGDSPVKGRAKKDDERKEGEGPPTREENRVKNDKKQGGNGPSIDERHIDKSLETCDGSLLRCEQQDLVACLQHSKIADPKELAILVQNSGDNTLDVNVAVPPSVTIDAKKLNLAKHSAEKVNISAGATKNLKIVLDAGKGQCVIQFSSGPSVSDWVQQFPAYARQLTPMYGAYFVFFILVIAGGVWGFCKFRRSRRRADDGVAYQQLEMGTQKQSSTEIVEESTVDGWEQGWDDDWDEEETTARLSSTRPNGNISANGLSSRSANKNNDWDIEWDD